MPVCTTRWGRARTSRGDRDAWRDFHMARVLLVDDDKDVLWLIAIVLQADPTLTLVGQAVDGESAVAMVQQHRPDLVLMDLMMPGFDGLEATRRIKEQWPETKILVLTSLTEDDFREVAYDSGADGFLNKRDIASRLLLAIRAVTSALRV